MHQNSVSVADDDDDEGEGLTIGKKRAGGVSPAVSYVVSDEEDEGSCTAIETLLFGLPPPTCQLFMPHRDGLGSTVSRSLGVHGIGSAVYTPSPSDRVACDPSWFLLIIKF